MLNFSKFKPFYDKPADQFLKVLTMNPQEKNLSVIPELPTVSLSSPTITVANPSPAELLTTEWIKVSLPAMLTLSNLNEFKAQLLQYLGRRVQLSGAKVERIDTASLQLLLAFVNSPEITVGWADPSSELYNAARLLGLSTELGLPVLGTIS